MTHGKDLTAGSPNGSANGGRSEPPRPVAAAGLADSRRGGSIEAAGQLTGTATGQVRWMIADEVPVALLYNGRERMVMMTSPADLEDFAVGFSVTEELVPSAAEIQDIEIRAKSIGYEIDMTVPREYVARHRLRQRGISGRTGCGLCGVESLAEAVREPRRVPTRLAVRAPVHRWQRRQ